jgi:hypothetical protein
MLGIMTVVAIIISLIASYFLSKRISSPIEKMDKEAKLMAKNDYEVHFEEKGPQEIVDLAIPHLSARAPAVMPRRSRWYCKNIANSLSGLCFGCFFAKAVPSVI